MMLKQSFAPIIPSNARILILGSLPGDLSIAKNQYYAHPQNRFWKILFTLFEKEFSTDYTGRVELLKTNRIALWDVCHSAIRPGSMDTNITEVVPNDITHLLNTHTSIKVIAFNGQKSEKLYFKYFERHNHITYLSLPSSSPANAQFNINNLLQYWNSIKTG